MTIECKRKYVVFTKENIKSWNLSGQEKEVVASLMAHCGDKCGPDGKWCRIERSVPGTETPVIATIQATVNSNVKRR